MGVSSIRFLSKIFAILIWLAAWQIASQIIDNTLLLVSPIAVFARLIELAATGGFWRIIGLSLSRILGGFLMSLLVGIILASISARNRLIYIILQPPLTIIKTVPVASFVILLIFWLGGERMAFAISFITVLPVIYFNVYEGIISIDPKILEMAGVFRISPLRRLRHIYFPHVLPHIIAAASSGLGFAFKAGISAEVIANVGRSIGFYLMSARRFLVMQDLFAWTIAIIVISVTIERGFLWILRKIAR
ncbi:MAG: ABC transporter permease subunit [Defluviitaleaceae bacterium]|nr:ABC transporter permease subunit [Defluviitaleaceae bacterium]